MRTLSHIETAVFLRRLDPFAHCTADQVLRIAAIAGERSFGAGERIYKPKDPADCIYCIVEGAVQLEDPGGSKAELVPPATFGMLEILSGRLRGASATATSDSLLLTIEAEDFFDLLSDNIEIVKALFRILTQRTEDSLDLATGTWRGSRDPQARR